MKLTKCAKALACAVMLASSFGASAAGLNFMVDETVVPDSASLAPLNNLSVDTMSGLYRELFTVTSPGNFSSIAFAQIGTFSSGSSIIASAATAGIGDPYTLLSGATNGSGETVAGKPYYALYGLFEATGSFSGGQFTGSTGEIELWLDPNRNTIAGINTANTNGYDASTPWTTILSGTADDIRLAFSSDLLYGFGDSVTGFDLVFQSLGLTTGAVSGDTYFVSPRPFHTSVRLDGAFEPFTAGGTSVIEGALTVQFTVPEPDAIGLLGLACTAGGLLALRRRRVA